MGILSGKELQILKFLECLTGCNEPTVFPPHHSYKRGLNYGPVVRTKRFFKFPTNVLSYFQQVIDHGIELNLLENIEKVAKDFFMLPLEEKKKYPMLPGTVQGYGQAFVFSENQKLDWCNMFALGVEPHFIRNPKLWPAKPAEFR